MAGGGGFFFRSFVSLWTFLINGFSFDKDLSASIGPGFLYVYLRLSVKSIL